MTKNETNKLAKLLYELEFVQGWLEDTGYPQRSKAEFDKALEEIAIQVRGKNEPR